MTADEFKARYAALSDEAATALLRAAKQLKRAGFTDDELDAFLDDAVAKATRGR